MYNPLFTELQYFKRKSLNAGSCKYAGKRCGDQVHVFAPDPHALTTA